VGASVVTVVETASGAYGGRDCSRVHSHCTEMARQVALPRSRKVRALLAYLALNPRPAGRPCPPVWSPVASPPRSAR
jgi:hypothetical protein